MNPDVKTKWVKRLRDTDNDMQGRNYLKDALGKMCCLGVLCEIAVDEGVIPSPVLYRDSIVHRYGQEKNSGALPQEVMEWSGLDSRDPKVSDIALSVYNDIRFRNFDEIADIIESGL